MPRLHYILADHLHLCYSCSLLSFHHRHFCEYFSCIFLPNLRILVPDRIVSFDQALLASSCDDFFFLFFFFLAQLLLIFNFSIFLPFSTHSTIWKSIYLFSPLSSFLGPPRSLLKVSVAGITCLFAGHPISPRWPGPCAALPVSLLICYVSHIVLFCIFLFLFTINFVWQMCSCS